MSHRRSNVARLGTPDPVLVRYAGNDAAAPSVSYIVCINGWVPERYSIPVKTLDLVSFRDTPVNTDNVTNGRSGGVATSIVDKDRIRSPKPSDIGTAATHDEIKNINEKLSIRKYLTELDFETIKILQRDHEARENMKEIET